MKKVAKYSFSQVPAFACITYWRRSICSHVRRFYSISFFFFYFLVHHGLLNIVFRRGEGVCSRSSHLALWSWSQHFEQFFDRKIVPDLYWLWVLPAFMQTAQITERGTIFCCWSQTLWLLYFGFFVTSLSWIPINLFIFYKWPSSNWRAV